MRCGRCRDGGRNWHNKNNRESSEADGCLGGRAAYRSGMDRGYPSGRRPEFPPSEPALVPRWSTCGCGLGESGQTGCEGCRRPVFPAPELPTRKYGDRQRSFRAVGLEHPRGVLARGNSKPVTTFPSGEFGGWKKWPCVARIEPEALNTPCLTLPWHSRHTESPS